MHDIAAWSECEHRALNAPRRQGRVVRVEDWMRDSAVAQLVDGVELRAPDMVRYDRRTTVQWRARQEATEYAARAAVLLQERGFDASRVKHEEHADMFWTIGSDGAMVLAVLSIGPMLGTAWLRLGAALIEESSLIFASVIHIPRGQWDSGAVETRQAQYLRRVAGEWVVRLAAISQGAPALRSPGLHCRWCRDEECPVRAEARA